eukprot:g2035.t1
MQRKFDVLKAEQQRKEMMMAMQTHRIELQTQRSIDLMQTQRAMDLMRAKQEKAELQRELKAREIKERELQHQVEQERTERKAFEERFLMQQQIRELAHRLNSTSDMQLTGPRPQPSMLPAPQLQLTEAEPEVVRKIVQKKADMADMQRQLLADRQEAERWQRKMKEKEQKLHAQQEALAHLETFSVQQKAIAARPAKTNQVHRKEPARQQENAQKNYVVKKTETGTSDEQSSEKGGAKGAPPADIRPVAAALPEGTKFHFFLSHSQSTGADQANSLYLELERMGYVCWYDNRAEDLTKEGMRQGIIDSGAFIVFLSAGILSRPFCQFEIREAVAHKKLIVLIREFIIVASFYDFYAEQQAAPADLRFLTDEIESLPFRRRGTFHKQLTGSKHSTNSSETLGRSKQEWNDMLVQTMVDKQRALVVLDDPWTPEQVRFLNPITGAQMPHRLLITTRIRDLMPKATRVELPLMDKEEAVALLLDLANVREEGYMKEHRGTAWPPAAAYAIASECGMLPITLTIAAQVVRGWGRGWEEVRIGMMAVGLMANCVCVRWEPNHQAVLPLLREQGASSVEERVIGAGLQAVEKHADGAAVKELFHMFAVTQEDFVHPMAVVELLWRSCCASESEREEGSLAARLKVRQQTQQLVDHSLLLGSSTEGIHLHDIILTYLRKRLSAKEMRAEHKKVVEGMVATAAGRMKSGGRGLQDTVDWYCCCMGSYHMKKSIEDSVAPEQSEDVRRWLLGNDSVLCYQATITIGEEGLKALAVEYEASGELYNAAKTQFALSALNIGDKGGMATLLKGAHVLLERSGTLNTIQGQQLECV